MSPFILSFFTHESRSRSRSRLRACDARTVYDASTFCARIIIGAHPSRMMRRALQAYNRIYSLSLALSYIHLFRVDTYMSLHVFRVIRVDTTTRTHTVTVYKYFCYFLYHIHVRFRGWIECSRSRMI